MVLVLRLFALAIVCWIAADLVSPTLPGIFAFSHPTLFIDGTTGRGRSLAVHPNVASHSEQALGRPITLLVRAPRIDHSGTRATVPTRSFSLDLSGTLPNAPPAPASDH